MNVWDDLTEAASIHPGVVEELSRELRTMAIPIRLKSPCAVNAYLVTGHCYSPDSVKIIHSDGTVEYREPEQRGDNG